MENGLCEGDFSCGNRCVNLIFERPPVAKRAPVE
jgi:hypothetical protein